jgi:hypothetical protein
MSIADAQKAVDAIIERRLAVLWKHNGLTRVLTNIPAREQILVLLFDESGQNIQKLKDAIEYKNVTDFRKLLRRLHDARLIEFSKDEVCTISPKGVIAAEEIIRQIGHAAAKSA